MVPIAILYPGPLARPFPRLPILNIKKRDYCGEHF